MLLVQKEFAYTAHDARTLSSQNPRKKDLNANSPPESRILCDVTLENKILPVNFETIQIFQIQIFRFSVNMICHRASNSHGPPVWMMMPR